MVLCRYILCLTIAAIEIHLECLSAREVETYIVTPVISLTESIGAVELDFLYVRPRLIVCQQSDQVV